MISNANPTALVRLQTASRIMTAWANDLAALRPNVDPNRGDEFSVVTRRAWNLARDRFAEACVEYSAAIENAERTVPRKTADANGVEASAT